MNAIKHRILGLAASAALTLAAAMPAAADDTEIFVPQSSGVKPNVLFILDTSGSMETDVVTENAPYDPSVTYAGTCNAARLYWLRDQGTPLTPPDCDTDNWFALSEMMCKAALDVLPTAGKFAAARAAQFDGVSGGDNRWEQIRATVKNMPVECRADAGIHGNGIVYSPPRLYARDHTNRWGGSGNQISWNANNTNRNYVFYSANYLNWFNNPSNVQVHSRLDVMKNVMADVLSDLKGVNVGLMRYSNNTDDGCGDGGLSAEGGMVTFPMSDIDSGTVRDDLITTVKNYNASGCTPLSETLYEAYLYLKGEQVHYGVDSRAFPGSGGSFPSVDGSRQADNKDYYESPLDYECQSTFIVYLTDGEPTADSTANEEIEKLTGEECDGSGDGQCLDDLAEYLYETDLSDVHEKSQNIKSHWIGFGKDVAGSALLQVTANRGGGTFYNANDTEGLTAVLSATLNNIANETTTFVAPSVSVNAFNRTQTLSDLYVSVFQPNVNLRWLGNIKKYEVVDGVIVDADGNPAVENGFFADGSRSIWSSVEDDAFVDVGGAASVLPIPANRKIYTNIDPSTNDLTAATNALSTANSTFITAAALGVGALGQPSVTTLVDFIRGLGTKLNPTLVRKDMGDPLHAKPAVVIYGGTVDAPDAVVFTPTNDGMIHAIDADDGVELWAFMPEEQLDNIISLYENPSSTSKHYSLDGEVRVLKYDVDQDGVVEPASGDKVLLYFGQRRGGSSYYALDVTVRDRPKHLWTIGNAQLPGVGQTWSAPVVGRVNVSGASQNSQKLVLIMGGGYDDTQDNYVYKTDSIGNSIYIVDALTGSRLWRGSRTGADGNFADMRHSIPSNVAVLDLDGDTFSDRMYVGDMGGLVWRFDIFNGETAANLVAGKPMADLGAYSLTAPAPLSASRRFYNTPDVALMKRRGKSTFFNIGIGSGYRGHPLEERNEDRFYAIRDYRPFDRLTQAQYDDTTLWTVRTDADYVDITDDVTPSLADDVPGWQLQLRVTGEKVLAESRTFNNSIFFPTYIPNTVSLSACEPPTGSNRVYVISAFDGSPRVEQDGVASDPDNDGHPDLTADDRFTELDQHGIAPETVMLFPGGGGAGEDPVVCLNGVEVLNVCEEFSSRVRTFWRESGAN